MKPIGWAIDTGMGAVRKWDRVTGRNNRGSRPAHRSDKHLRSRDKRQNRREIQEQNA